MQRRLGMFASVSDLTDEFKGELRGIRTALEQQRACNLVVDAVVAEEVRTSSKQLTVIAYDVYERDMFVSFRATN